MDDNTQNSYIQWNFIHNLVVWTAVAKSKYILWYMSEPIVQDKNTSKESIKRHPLRDNTMSELGLSGDIYN